MSPRTAPILPHIGLGSLTTASPTVHSDLLKPWPENQNTVVGLSDAVMQIFSGPRVLSPDGFSQRKPNVRAYYYGDRASFTHSIGVIASNDERDSPLLKFAAVYLRSTPGPVSS